MSTYAHYDICLICHTVQNIALNSKAFSIQSNKKFAGRCRYIAHMPESVKAATVKFKQHVNQN